MAFCLALLNCQCQLQALGGGKPLVGAHLVTPAPASTTDHNGTALDNLALAVLNTTAHSHQPGAHGFCYLTQDCQQETH